MKSQNDKGIPAHAVIYTRVSTVEQIDNYSLDTQERKCKEECERLGLVVDRVFREEGESATTANRTELQNMLNYLTTNAKKKNILFVVIAKVDRLSRVVLDYQVIKASLKTLKIQVKAVQESFDDSAGGQLVENMMSAIAQFDNDQRRQRTEDGMKAGMSMGRWMWRAPIGFKKPPPTPLAPSLVLDEEVAPIVRLAFEMASTGAMSKIEILRKVTDMGLLTPAGKSLSPQAFGKMLTNPLYMGRVVKSEWGIDADGDFEPIISVELFDTVQEIDSKKPSLKDRRHRDNPDFPLRRVAKCPGCGSSITGSWSKGRNRKFAYYCCPKASCKAYKTPKHVLEAQFIKKLESLSVKAEAFELLKAVIEDLWKDRSEILRSSQISARKELEELDKRTNRLVDAFIQEKSIDQSTYESQQERISEAKIRASRVLRENTVNPIALVASLEFAETLLINLPECWNRLQWQDRPAFLSVIFPTGFTPTAEGIGTGDTPWIFKTIDNLSSPTSTLAPLTGVEPLINWLFSWLDQLQDEATDLRSLRHEEVHELQNEHAVNREA